MEFKEFKIFEVESIVDDDKIKSSVIGFSKILDLACKNQDINKPFTPFVILEDDTKKYRKFPVDIKIPDDTDILYIGLSSWGMTASEKVGKDGSVCFKNINNRIIKVFNMLSTHGLVVVSLRGLLSLQKCLFEDMFKNRGYDMSLASIQPFLNVYALNIPLVYQFGEIGGQEKQTKLKFKSLEEKKYPENWLHRDNLSVLSLHFQENDDKKFKKNVGQKVRNSDEEPIKNNPEQEYSENINETISNEINTDFESNHDVFNEMSKFKFN